MEMLRLCSVLSLLVASAVLADKATFHNYQVHRVVPNTPEQLRALQDLENHPNGLDFWVESSHLQKAVDVMVPPHLLPQFNEMMASLHLDTEVYIDDVQRLVDAERSSGKARADFGWTDYHTLDEIYAWLDSLVASYPGQVTAVVGGQSYEGRDIQGVKVSFAEGNPSVFIEAGIHAREWIGPATAMYILNKLLTSEDPVLKDLRQSFDFYVFPSTNPDGYVYTHTTDRMWRKTRSLGDDGCYGADPNRNWDFHWMEVGASSDPCSSSYGGKSAFSEVETRSLADYIRGLAGNLTAYLDFHSYSQVLMLPYGLRDEHVDNYDELMSLGKEAVAALAKNNGTQYEVGTIYDIMYPSAGSSLDWVRGTFDVPYTYAWELRDTGRYGFLLPADQIIDTAEETLNSVVVILQHAKK